MNRACILAAGLSWLLLSGCGAGAFGNFTDGLRLDRCDDTFPVCQTTAGCVLGPQEYIEGQFPGQRQFIVPAAANAVVAVEIFFRDATASGVDSEIRWHEPGCFETQRWQSRGQDIFLISGQDQVLRQERQVEEDGDHLIEVFSDAVLDYFLRVQIDQP